MAALSIRPAQAQLATSSNLTVEVTGIKNSDGQICLSLFASRNGFPSDKEAIIANQCTAAVETTPTEAAVAVTFADLEPGTYAISVIHDENEDDRLNIGSFGVPTEGFGFSRNPAITTRPPEFSESAVIVFGRNTTTPVELIYY
ncbi:MAG: DUF2141 domain-containing protein [Phormidesmis sp.]